jgi:hypothetical protein
MVGEQAAVGLRGILRTSIRVVDAALRRSPGVEGGCHPADHRMLDPALDVFDDLPGIALVQVRPSSYSSEAICSCGAYASHETKSPAAEPGLLDEGVSKEVILDAMIKHPILVNRPIVCTPKGVRLSSRSGP